MIMNKDLKERGELKKWQDKYAIARSKFAAELDQMSDRDNIYLGRRDIDANPNNNTTVTKKTPSVRNISFELIESQVESDIPQPKVTAREDRPDQAKIVEDVLRGEIARLPFEAQNDEQERTCPIQGSSYFHVEWDSLNRTHTTVGELSIELLHPDQVIPQEGVVKINKADYIFVVLQQTKEYIKRRYGKDVKEDEDELVTQVITYYRNDKNGIGLFTWAGDTILENLDDFYARQQKQCLTCDAPYPRLYDECPYCESKKSEVISNDYEELTEDMILPNGKVIPAITVKPKEIFHEGMLIGTEYEEVSTRIPYYKPNCFPLVMRKNVSVSKRLLGNSDIDAIRDQQNETNKLLTKIGEKIYKGGSYVTLPEDAKVSKTDEELKVIRVRTPDKVKMIQVLNIQPDITKDSVMLEAQYEYARQTLGITESFQGRRDTSAISGKAKEFAAAQTAGRLESKRVMKNAAYADLFKIMFKFLLAYADEPRPFKADDQGDEVYRVFDRHEFIEQDSTGEWYYNDGFIFSTDDSGGLAANREAMWQETKENFAAGTFGNPMEPETLILYWTALKKLHYPGAGDMLTALEERNQEPPPPPPEAPQDQMTGMIPEMSMQGMGQIPMDMQQGQMQGIPPEIMAQLPPELQAELQAMPPEMAQQVLQQLLQQGGG
jgi:hypothetical protein